MKKRAIRIAVAVVVLGAFLYAGRAHLDEVSRLRHVSPTVVAAMLVVYLVTRVLNGEVLRVTLGALGRTIGCAEAFVVMMVMSYTNLLVPRAGLSAPALYLKRKHGLQYSEFAAMLIPMTLVHLACSGWVGLASQLLLAAQFSVPVHPGLALLFGAIAVCSPAALLVRIRLPGGWRGRVARAARRLFDSWQLLARHKGMIVHVVVAQLAVLALRAVRLQLALVALGVPVNFFGTMIVSLLAQLAILIGLTPGGLGMREGAICYGYHLLGTPIETGIAAALLDRAVMTLCVVVIGQLGLWRMLRFSAADGAEQPRSSRLDEAEGVSDLVRSGRAQSCQQRSNSQ